MDAADAERRARFIHEAKAASVLNHPNIVTIHEIGEQDCRTFMAFPNGPKLTMRKSNEKVVELPATK
jgi:hypothetical protein